MVCQRRGGSIGRGVLAVVRWRCFGRMELTKGLFIPRNVAVMPSAYHDATAGSIERGNALGDRSSVRQSLDTYPAIQLQPSAIHSSERR